MIFNALPPDLWYYYTPWTVVNHRLSYPLLTLFIQVLSEAGKNKRDNRRSALWPFHAKHRPFKI